MILTISAGRRVFQQRRGGAEPQRKDRKTAEAKRKGQRRRADEDIVRRDVEYFPRIAIRDDQEIAMEMHRRLRLARRARGKAEQRDIVAAGLDRIEANRLVQRHPVELGVVVRRAVEIHDLLEESAGLGACDQLVGDAAVGQRERDLRLVDDLGQFAGAKHRHGVDDDGACLRRRKPCGDQRRIVAGAYQHAIAGLDAVILHQCMRKAVGPVRQLLVGALAAVADQRDAIAKALLDHAVGQFDRGIEIFRDTETPAGRACNSGHCSDGGRFRRAKSST